jgi:Cu2+-containing amine oxidase
MSSDRRPSLGVAALALWSWSILTTGVPASAEEQVAAPLVATHPMDALTAVEITASARILRAAGKLGDNVRIVSLSLEENAKAEVRAWATGQPFSRHAFAVLLTDGKVAEAHIDLDAQALTAWTRSKTVRPR